MTLIFLSYVNMRCGSDITDAHVLEDFTYHDFAPAVFREIRAMYNSNKPITSVNQKDPCKSSKSI